MMIAVAVIATLLLAAAALLAVVRLERGPSMLDRTIAFDVLTTALVGAIAVEAALSRRTELVPILVVLSMVGFVGSVTIARFAAVEPPKDGAPGSRSTPRRRRGHPGGAGVEPDGTRDASPDAGSDTQAPAVTEGRETP
ncbi:MAG TPA: monovalent cation/H+ antiporter complex subunit F [Promicromonospora sp.]|nr:monovalent cation/H+ antiporter complex subunit F [Promicromonospora sp.]